MKLKPRDVCTMSKKNMAYIELYQIFYYICRDLTTKTSRCIGNRYTNLCV